MKTGILVVSIIFVINAIVVGQVPTWQSEQYTTPIAKKTTLKSYNLLNAPAGGDENDPDNEDETPYNTIEVGYSTWIHNSAVGIGVHLDEESDYMLGVKGTIGASRVEVKATYWADDVFEEDYDLPSIAEVETFIGENSHLPGVPSEEEVMKENIDLGSMDATLLRKIEELTLYIIEQNKRIGALEEQLKAK